MAANTPVDEFNVGRVKVTIWPNGGEAGSWFTARFSRLYKKGESWKSTPRFKREDLHLLAQAAGKALAWMDERERDADDASGDVSVEDDSHEDAAGPDAPDADETAARPPARRRA